MNQTHTAVTSSPIQPLDLSPPSRKYQRKGTGGTLTLEVTLPSMLSVDPSAEQRTCPQHKQNLTIKSNVRASLGAKLGQNTMNRHYLSGDPTDLLNKEVFIFQIRSWSHDDPTGKNQ
jgi:hypothetical protein